MKRDRRQERKMEKMKNKVRKKTALITLCICNKLIMTRKRTGREKKCFLHSLIGVSQTAER